MNNQWSNWAGNVTCQPLEIFKPTSESELQAFVKKAYTENKRIRVVGSGHSFTPIAATDEYMLSLVHMQGLIHLDKSKKQATVWAGTTIKQLGILLHKEGLAQVNLGDIDKQSVAGATSTGTHGTGINFGSLSTQIIGLTLVLANGELLQINENENPELLDAARVGLGVLGIITQVTLQLTDSYKLEYKASKGSLKGTLAELEIYKAKNRNFEFYWFPYTDAVQLKFSNESQEAVQDSAFKRYINQHLMENKALGFLCKIGAKFPSSYKKINKIMGAAIGSERKVNYSHLVYATERAVKFKEMEYNIPAEHFVEVMLKIQAAIEKHQFNVFFPIECRWVQADNIWLSPAHNRASAYIAFHVYEGTEHEAYFKEMENICRQYNGRPHWGKMHTRTYEDLKIAYPKFEDFCALRKRLDEKGLLLNPHTAKIFGVALDSTTAPNMENIEIIN